MSDNQFNILFVCLGNICRSPLAAGIMKQIYKEQGISGTIESAGTEDWNKGSPADRRAIKIALDCGVDIRDHRARQIQFDDFERFDLIVAMDANNEKVLNSLAPKAVRGKIRRILEFAADTDGDIPDPYHGSEQLFRTTFLVIHKGCAGLAKELISQEFG